MIKTVIFDLDGMIYQEKDLFSNRLAKKQNLPKEKIMPFFQDEFKNCLTGKKDLKKAIQPYLTEWKWKGSVDSLLDLWFGSGKMNKEMADLIHKLRSRGLFCVLCTNNERYRMEYLKSKYNLTDLFDEILASYEIGTCKPQQKMFDRIKMISSPVRSILYFDDREENIERAKDSGLDAVHFESIEQFKEQLEKRGLSV